MGNWLAFFVIIPLTRLIPRTSLASGLFLQAVASYAMAQFDVNLTSFDILWSNILLGFGQSIAFTPMTMLAFTTLPKERITEGATIFTLMRNFGSSIFISFAVLVLLRTSSQNYSNISEKISVLSGGRELLPPPSFWSLDNLFGLSQLSNEVQRQASMIGYINSFHLMAFAALAAVPLVAFMTRSQTKNNNE